MNSVTAVKPVADDGVALKSATQQRYERRELFLLSMHGIRERFG